MQPLAVRAERYGPGGNTSARAWFLPGGAAMSGAQRLDWISRPVGSLQGNVVVPGDKSVSHRSMMLSAIAEGTSHIRGFLEGEDTRATAAVLAQLGVSIEAPSAGERIVRGVGLHGLRGSSQPLDCGNAGTGMRLIDGFAGRTGFR